ncbi:MAG: hypothetical protein JWL82_239 [Parcubacteria group bacterium]|nr:hypothetical protein [Parcubacteria group bacterium]
MDGSGFALKSLVKEDDTVIIHRPCFWNPHGATRKDCELRSGSELRNPQCCAIQCTSPQRLCHRCISKGPNPRTVTDFLTGLCDEHTASTTPATDNYLLAHRTESLQVLPDHIGSTILYKKGMAFFTEGQSGKTDGRRHRKIKEPPPADIHERVGNLIETLSPECKTVLDGYVAGMKYYQIMNKARWPKRHMATTVTALWEHLQIDGFARALRIRIAVGSYRKP